MLLPPPAAAHGLVSGSVQALRDFCALSKILVCGAPEEEASWAALDNEAVAGRSPWLWCRTRATKSRRRAWPLLQEGSMARASASFFHSGLQILDLTLLLFHEQIFYPIKLGPYLGAQIHHLGTHLLDILVARGGLEPFVNHLGKPFNRHSALPRSFL
jgi:hypothetical protein